MTRAVAFRWPSWRVVSRKRSRGEQSPRLFCLSLALRAQRHWTGGGGFVRRNLQQRKDRPCVSRFAIMPIAAGIHPALVRRPPIHLAMQTGRNVTQQHTIAPSLEPGLCSLSKADGHHCDLPKLLGSQCCGKNQVVAPKQAMIAAHADQSFRTHPPWRPTQTVAPRRSRRLASLFRVVMQRRTRLSGERDSHRNSPGREGRSD